MSLLTHYTQLLEAHHAIARRSLAGLKPEALDWTTESSKNSLATLACHIAGSERYSIGTVISRDPEPRDRTAEFQASGLSEEELAAKIDWAEAYTRRAVASLTPADLDELRPTSDDETTRDVSVAWALLHVLEHTAYHAGQMNLIRKMYLDSRAP